MKGKLILPADISDEQIPEIFDGSLIIAPVATVTPELTFEEMLEQVSTKKEPARKKVKSWVFSGMITLSDGTRYAKLYRVYPDGSQSPYPFYRKVSGYHSNTRGDV